MGIADAFALDDAHYRACQGKYSSRRMLVNANAGQGECSTRRMPPLWRMREVGWFPGSRLVNAPRWRMRELDLFPGSRLVYAPRWGVREEQTDTGGRLRSRQGRNQRKQGECSSVANARGAFVSREQTGEERLTQAAVESERERRRLYPRIRTRWATPACTVEFE
jgi:hypothetical protein